MLLKSHHETDSFHNLVGIALSSILIQIFSVNSCHGCAFTLRTHLVLVLVPHLEVYSQLRVLLLPSELRVLGIGTSWEALDGLVEIVHLHHVSFYPLEMDTELKSISEGNPIWIVLQDWEVVSCVLVEEVVVSKINLIS